MVCDEFVIILSKFMGRGFNCGIKQTGRKLYSINLQECVCMYLLGVCTSSFVKAICYYQVYYSTLWDKISERNPKLRGIKVYPLLGLPYIELLALQWFRV